MLKPSAGPWIAALALGAAAASAARAEHAPGPSASQPDSPVPEASAPRASTPRTGAPHTSAMLPCLADGSGYLRARVRGAIEADIDWNNAALECDGGARPDGHGIRVSFAGTLRADRTGGAPSEPRSGAAGSAGYAPHRLRLVFGIEAPGEGQAGRDRPANVTLILEGERRGFSTRGDDKCTVDELRQERLEPAVGRDSPREGGGAVQNGRTGGGGRPAGNTGRRYRVTARGFCIGPAGRIGGAEHVLVSRFDFAGRISIYTDGAAAPASRTPTDSRRLAR